MSYRVDLELINVGFVEVKIYVKLDPITMEILFLHAEKNQNLFDFILSIVDFIDF